MAFYARLRAQQAATCTTVKGGRRQQAVVGRIADQRR